jgi:hypothetical protein
MKINHWFVLAVGSILTTVAIAKLPTPVLTEEQKAKAEEAKAKAADAAKKSAADEQRYQDRVADRYFKELKAAGKTVPMPQWVPPPVAPAAPAAPAAAAPAAPVTPAKLGVITPKKA